MVRTFNIDRDEKNMKAIRPLGPNPDPKDLQDVHLDYRRMMRRNER